MKRNFLTTTLVSMSLLSLNLSAAGGMECKNGFCMVKIQKPSSIKKQEIKKETAGYKTVVVDKIETIIFDHSKYIMTEVEVAEYDLEKMQQLNNLSIPVLEENVVIGCEDNLKPVKVAGIANTYKCG